MERRQEMVVTRLTLMASLLALLGFGFLTVFPSGLPAAEKLKYSSTVKLYPGFYLPILAAQDKGIWKENGLDIEWVSFRSGSSHYRAIAAGAINIGSSMVAASLHSAARGVPTIIVSNLQLRENFAVWVLSKGRFRAPKDLKGTKIGVSRFGGSEHSYGRMVAKQLGLSNQVKFISTGGIRESLASLTTGSIDAVVLTPARLISLKMQGKVKDLLQVADYRPKPWTSFVVVAHKNFVRDKPDTVKRSVKSILRANRFIESEKGRPWTLAKMKEMNRYSDKAAEFVYDSLEFSLDGKLEKKGIENVRSFMIEFGIIKAEDAPPVDALYTDRFVR